MTHRHAATKYLLTLADRPLTLPLHMDIPNRGAFSGPIHLPAGTRLFAPFDDSRHVLYVIRGRVHVYAQLEGERPVLIECASRDRLVGASLPLSGARSLLSAQVVEPTDALTMSASTFRITSRLEPAFTTWIQGHLVASYRQLLLRAATLGASSSTRLQWELARELASGALPGSNGMLKIVDVLTPQNLASAIGVTREHLYTLVARLEEQGWLQRNRGWYLVPADSPLKDLASIVACLLEDATSSSAAERAVPVTRERQTTSRALQTRTKSY